MGLEKYKVKKNYHRAWNPGERFTCPKCGSKCGKENSQLINQGDRVARWCSECSYYEVNVAN